MRQQVLTVLTKKVEEYITSNEKHNYFDLNTAMTEGTYEKCQTTYSGFQYTISAGVVKKPVEIKNPFGKKMF